MVGHHLLVVVRPNVDLHGGEVSETVLGEIGRAEEDGNSMGYLMWGHSNLCKLGKSCARESSGGSEVSRGGRKRHPQQDRVFVSVLPRCFQRWCKEMSFCFLDIVPCPFSQKPVLRWLKQMLHTDWSLNVSESAKPHVLKFSAGATVRKTPALKLTSSQICSNTASLNHPCTQ